MNEDNVHIPRSLDTPNGRLYAEWALLLQDLGVCLEVAELWKTRSQEEEAEVDRMISASLFRDAVVRFIACFDKEALVCLDAAELYEHPRIKGGMDYFRWLSGIRDTWIAHRHGAYRQAHAVVAIEEGTGKLIGVGTHIVSVVSYDYAGKDGFIALIRIAIHYAEKRVEEQARVVEQDASSMHATQRLRLPIATTKVPDERSLRLGRKKFGRINRLARKDIDIPPDI